ncbi:MAG TPA: cyclic nucleotide-binding domain-containing protein [Gallionella sp.]|nr:cyclic nucleotide-binding domain-containing protein [Gallionella sp.]
MADHYKIVIIGAGPAGMSAAARAAELGVSHVLLEAAPHPANTMHHYQRRKLVMAEPAVLPLRSTLTFGAGIREHILQCWQEELVAHRVNLRVNAAVSGISGRLGAFQVTLATGEVLSAEFVVLAIGLQGNIRKLGVPGEDLPGVQYQLDDPEAFNGETIVVIGAGDAGVENALALAEHNRVIFINRQEEFTSCSKTNFDLLMAEVTKGRIETQVSTWAERVEQSTGRDFPLVLVVHTSQGLARIECHRVIARLGAKPPRQLVESFGVQFPNGDSTAVPQLTEQYESNVPGLYVVGALAGYPLIKQAMNQGYEVVEYIQGNPVEPADEALLRDKFSGVPEVRSVNDGIALIRRNQPLFATLTTLQLREFMLDSTLWVPQCGEVLFKRNDYSSSFFSILSGSVTIHTEGKDGAVSTFRLGAGEFFGEMGLLSGRRRSGTAVAGEGCVLVETPRRSMLKLLYAVPGVRRRLDEVALKRIVQNSLDAALPEHEFEHLVQDAQFKQYAVGEALFKEGDQVDGLYLIRRGSVTVSRLIAGKEVMLAYVSAGNYVGEMALVSNTLRLATVRAASPTDVVLLEAGRVRAVMERNASIRGKVDSRYLERIGADVLPEDTSFSGLIKFLMTQGVGEATDVLLIDYERCIRCDNCETACADVHGGISRLDREAGMTYEQIHLPTSCRHCEHPHCMKDCPPDAIQRAVNGEVFISDSCIGCGNCQKNCPYGVIQMAVQSEPQQGGIWQILFGSGKKAVVEADASVSKKAVKCDMCKGIRGGPLCVNACPTGAAFRVSPEGFFSHVGWASDADREDRS